jgi:hypothetical protein
MRKLIIIILFLFGSILWSQDLLNRTVHGGDINPLNNLITIEQLINFTRSDLRILRNTIYAKYGYIFNSIDLQNHFSRFSWYNGILTNADNLLTAIDKENIDLILRIESNFPEINNSTNSLIGNWYYFGGVASEGMDNITLLINTGDRVMILPNGIYVYYVGSHNEPNVRRRGVFFGLWSLQNNIFETIPIGEHRYFLPTYGKVEKFIISTFRFNDGSINSECALFDRGGFVKE